MKSLALLLLVPSLATAAGATDAVSLGYSDQGTTIGSDTDACYGGILYTNHDGSFENGYAWQYGGCVAPYYGAFGEAYGGQGPNQVDCAALWVTTLPGQFQGQTCDIYVWNDGVSSPPTTVVGMVAGAVLSNVPNWPTCAQNDITTNIYVMGDFTVGYWGNWPGAQCGWFCAADLDGPGGYPWTYIAPGIGYPTGWNDPSIIWGQTQSLGLAAYTGVP